MPVSERKGPLDLPEGGLIVFGVKRPPKKDSKPSKSDPKAGETTQGSDAEI